MRVRFALPLLLVALSSTAAYGQAAPATPASDLELIRQQARKIVTVEPTRIGEASVAAVFAAPFYNLKIDIHEGEGSTSGTTLVVTRQGDSLAVVSRPSSDTDCPELLRMLNPKFKLRTPLDAEILQNALDAVFPIIGPDKSARAIRHAGNAWTFVRGTFFDDGLGFVFTTDAAGTITGVKFGLKVAPKAAT